MSEHAVITEVDVTAAHEAGHVVATLLRRGKVLSVSLIPTAEHLGVTYVNAKPWDMAFITYAGPWAEARLQWGDEPLDGYDDNGCSFSDYVTAAFFQNASDREDYACLIEEARTAPWGGDAYLVREAEWTYDCELKYYWSTIQRVADGLLAGRLTGDDLESFMPE